jgi:hypothetical protein
MFVRVGDEAGRRRTTAKLLADRCNHETVA